MTNPAISRFIKDYREFNDKLSISHPYFQQIQYEKINSMIISEMLKRTSERILDIGSGEGHLIHGFSAVAKECYALDIEAERLKKLHLKNPKIHGITANAEKGLPFKDNSFDGIVASELLEHLNDPLAFYKEISRTLKKGGVLILTTPNKDNLAYKVFSRLPKKLAVPIAKKAGADLALHPELKTSDSLNRSDPHAHKVEGYSKEELVNLGGKYRLKCVFHRCFGVPIPDSTYLHFPRGFTRMIVNRIEDRIPYALRHLIVYENK